MKPGKEREREGVADKKIEEKVVCAFGQHHTDSRSENKKTSCW